MSEAFSGSEAQDFDFQLHLKARQLIVIIFFMKECYYHILLARYTGACLPEISSFQQGSDGLQPASRQGSSSIFQHMILLLLTVVTFVTLLSTLHVPKSSLNQWGLNFVNFKFFSRK